MNNSASPMRRGGAMRLGRLGDGTGRRFRTCVSTGALVALAVLSAVPAFAADRLEIVTPTCLNVAAKAR